MQVFGMMNPKVVILCLANINSSHKSHSLFAVVEIPGKKYFSAIRPGTAVTQRQLACHLFSCSGRCLLALATLKAEKFSLFSIVCFFLNGDL